MTMINKSKKEKIQKKDKNKDILKKLNKRKMINLILKS